MAQGKRNPDWTKEELTLALDTYLKIMTEGSILSDTNSTVVELSKTLNSLTIHLNDKRDDKFRHPPGVRRRISYFKQLAEGQDIKGREAYVNVWNEYSKNPLQLRTEVARILQQFS